ncbi:hypothetical protein BV898_07302 [Hypsibius exemplaris]|uniref:Uncharacterized protein n=1 Tax=Hypsibius exemplaris TaxID=2072580 RepID=A0A1W0WTZ7_HYPEX|nr:hypothetical protein BV898_07302 [Hypsibius exemplaris]
MGNFGRCVGVSPHLELQKFRKQRRRHWADCEAFLQLLNEPSSRQDNLIPTGFLILGEGPRELILRNDRTKLFPAPAALPLPPSSSGPIGFEVERSETAFPAERTDFFTITASIEE